MAVVKTRLSRQYVYLPFAGSNVNLGAATVHRVAFVSDPTSEPVDADWREAIVVTATNGTGGAPHSLWDDLLAAVAPGPGAAPAPPPDGAFAILVGPTRGDTVTTEDLAVGEYLAWSDTKVPGSDERPATWHGPVSIVAVA